MWQRLINLERCQLPPRDGKSIWEQDSYCKTLVQLNLLYNNPPLSLSGLNINIWKDARWSIMFLIIISSEQTHLWLNVPCNATTSVFVHNKEYDSVESNHNVGTFKSHGAFTNEHHFSYKVNAKMWVEVNLASLAPGDANNANTPNLLHSFKFKYLNSGKIFEWRDDADAI